tara:strand:+ start:840 stop:1325 length:486 start_codon:yes stop_codon:yes gene_type:complete
MAIASVLTDSFKTELMRSGHNFDTAGATPAGSAFKLALYTSSANLGTTTTVYSATNEITNAAGSAYSAGGKALTNSGVTTSTVTSHTDFSDLSVANGTAWTTASFTTRGCLIYNTSVVSGFTTNRAVCSIDFGGDKTVSNGTFSIEFPTNSSSAAIIRLTS